MRYKHDCADCKPLGEFGTADLYFHASKEQIAVMVVARYSSKPEDYHSGLVGVDRILDLAEAKKRAIEMGYLPTSPMPEIEPEADLSAAPNGP